MNRADILIIADREFKVYKKEREKFMPELPEVETIAKELNQRLAGLIIRKARVFFEKTVTTPRVKEFCHHLEGTKIQSVSRRGKYLVLSLSDGFFLVIHLRMTGRFIFASSEDPIDKHHHIVIDFDKKRQLRFHDTRKFGRWSLVNSLEKILGKLGPEPLEETFTFSTFQNRIKKHPKRKLKPLLLDQQFVAGIGNIYVDEALWEAQLHPKTSVEKLNSKDIQNLYHAIRQVLNRGLENNGTSLGIGKTNYSRVNGERGNHQTQLSVFRQTGKACPRCGTPIQRIVVAQRGTHLCPVCQKK
jgi:formamidopyrimidine-DNA glycosylase